MKEGWYLDGDASGAAYVQTENTDAAKAVYESICSYVQNLQNYAEGRPSASTGKYAGYLYSVYSYEKTYDTTYLIMTAGDGVFLLCLDDADQTFRNVNQLLQAASKSHSTA